MKTESTMVAVSGEESARVKLAMYSETGKKEKPCNRIVKDYQQNCDERRALFIELELLTTLQNKGFFMKPSCGGKKRGRRIPDVYLGTGRRGRRPSSAIPHMIVVTIAQMRSVHWRPT